MSEGSGPVTTTTKEHKRLGSIGKEFVGMEVKIDSPNPLTEGEVWRCSFALAQFGSWGFYSQ